MRIDFFAAVLALVSIAFPYAFPHVDPRLAVDALWFALGVLVGDRLCKLSPTNDAQPAAVADKTTERLPEKGYGFLQSVRKDPPSPNMPLIDVVSHVESWLDGNDGRDKLDVDLLIADSAVEKQLTVWARHGNKPREVINNFRLRRARFLVRSGILKINNDWGQTTTFVDVMFDRSQVEDAWPTPTGEDIPTHINPSLDPRST